MTYGLLLPPVAHSTAMNLCLLPFAPCLGCVYYSWATCHGQANPFGCAYHAVDIRKANKANSSRIGWTRWLSTFGPLR
ncbi:hypothetical protein GQ44DRAFT_145115 [Phaeosphaeriaceae sp. PMI808]|nr:hypothetical protein GQ44DRAFT_145115 [Phaeosphaeriaceae sp. PMI808]